MPELQWAGARAHNRWLAELCQMAPERRAGVAIVPDRCGIVEEAAREVELGPGERPARNPHPVASGASSPPTWTIRATTRCGRACEELGMVVHFHSGAAPMEDYGEGTSA